MTNIRNSLNDLATAIEKLQKAPAPSREINDRELSGNKINGGIITAFSSVGIADVASRQIIAVKDDGIHVDTIHASSIENDLTVNGGLTVHGSVTAERMHVKEITADVRNERTDPLSFTAKGNKTAYGKGLIWPGGEYTKQFTLQERPDRFFATESIDLRDGKIYMINGKNVLAEDELGRTVTKSYLRNVGALEKLNVDGPLTVDNYLYFDANTQRLGLGTDAPNGDLSLMSWDHEFVINSTDDRKFELGTYTNTGLNIITDDTTRIKIDFDGTVSVEGKTVFKKAIGVGVKNFSNDADITSAGPIRFQNKKFEVGTSSPDSGNYIKGDIVWNDEPKQSSYIGWVCVKSGTPGEWLPFGQIK